MEQRFGAVMAEMITSFIALRAVNIAYNFRIETYGILNHNAIKNRFDNIKPKFII